MSNRSFAQQKAALTRVMKPILAARSDVEITDEAVDKVLAEIRRTRDEWNTRQAPFNYGWPDDWARWQRALNDLPGHLWSQLENI